MVNDALSTGYVEALPNPAHAKSKLIALTASGAQIIASIQAQEEAYLTAIGASITVEKIATAQKVMSTLLAGFTAYRIQPPGTGPRTKAPTKPCLFLTCNPFS